MAFDEYLAARIRDALARKRSVITGRPMKGWVLIEPEGIEDDEQLSIWIQRALKFVRMLPTKEE